MESTRYQVKPKKDNASYGNQNQEQQLAHFRETLSNLPTAESLAELLIPSAPPLEEAYQDNHDDFPFNNVVIPSAPPMEDSHQIDVVLLDRPSHHPANTCLKTNRTSITKVSTSTTARFAAMLCCNDSKRILRAGNCHHKANF
ncbi:hypothetical protein B9Z55_023438 [Caenorhabditis nigoni]|uniref:Uncharacterized protein n=1 Tax=Caenorhabditis nigoni TaxID=1611254 RepID=A0A2G5SPR0_9PELO|nr:hypothetical protein B9Z55_023438 [Caenorhabditis nigoni]